MAGRPSKHTPERVDRFIEAIKVGAPYELACDYAGWDYSTFRKWMAEANAEGDGNRYFPFFERVKEAEAAGALVNLGLIRKAASKQWQAAAWLLERRYPDQFARRDNVNVEGSLSVNAMVKEIVGVAAKRMTEEKGPTDVDPGT